MTDPNQITNQMSQQPQQMPGQKQAQKKKSGILEFILGHIMPPHDFIWFAEKMQKERLRWSGTITHV